MRIAIARTLMDQLIGDIRYGFRTLVRHRGYTLLALITLALGIGANTAIFSVISGVLLKPLPYGEPDRLVVVRQSAPGAGLPIVNLSFLI